MAYPVKSDKTEHFLPFQIPHKTLPAASVIHFVIPGNICVCESGTATDKVSFYSLLSAAICVNKVSAYMNWHLVSAFFSSLFSDTLPSLKSSSSQKECGSWKMGAVVRRHLSLHVVSLGLLPKKQGAGYFLEGGLKGHFAPEWESSAFHYINE